MKNFKKIIFVIAAAVILFGISVANNVVFAAETELYVGGFASGFTIKPDGAYIIGLSDVITEESVDSPAKNADLRVGDIILTIGGDRIVDALSLAGALAKSDGGPVEIVVRRGDEEQKKFITPKKDKTGAYKLGVLVRDDLSGIGTMTYFTEDGKFAALGHPVLNERNEIIKISFGTSFLCSIIGLNKGVKGKAGELKGIFIDDGIIGKITENRDTGIYGEADKSFDYKKYPKMQIGSPSVGKATILTCIDGTETKEYSIDIIKVDKNNKENKNLVIGVTDGELKKLTGGILQGMSGSPIIQDGKIVGAVTHVFINDPTKGYGITIANML